MSGVLYVVATPIGNLADISRRALDTLGKVDYVAAEDTRRSRNLLRHFAISVPLLSYHEHSSGRKHAHLLELLGQGKDIAIISDAGLPGISDPGEQLIADWIALGGQVTVIPGATAFLAGLLLSGLPTGSFIFEGFLPRGKRQRRRLLADLARERRTLIFYEAPHRLRDTLADMAEAFGDRKAVIAREITKLYEEVLRGTLAELVALCQEREVIGEIVLVVAGAAPVAEDAMAPVDPTEAVVYIKRLLSDGQKPSQAARLASQTLGLDRQEAYRLVLEAARHQAETGEKK